MLVRTDQEGFGTGMQTWGSQLIRGLQSIGNLSEKEFRIMIIKSVKNLENRMGKMQESMNKDLDKLKNEHTETNNTITPI